MAVMQRFILAWSIGSAIHEPILGALAGVPSVIDEFALFLFSLWISFFRGGFGCQIRFTGPAALYLCSSFLSTL
jgi:hypothetical protein